MINKFTIARVGQHIPTPWGMSDFVENIGGGILAVTTPSHGGYYVPREHYDRMPAQLQGSNSYGGGLWFEEDCEWAIVAFAFPELFNMAQLKAAVQTMNHYNKPGGIYYSVWQWLNETEPGQGLKQLALKSAA